MPGMEIAAPERTETRRGILRIAEFFARHFFQLLEILFHFLIESVRPLLAILEIEVADIGGDRESGWDGETDLCHFRQACAFSAERFFHAAIALGDPVSERVHKLLFSH